MLKRIQVISQAIFGRIDPKVALLNEVQDRALELERTILVKQLQLIEDQCRLDAEQAKREAIMQWLNRNIPKSVRPVSGSGANY